MTSEEQKVRFTIPRIDTLLKGFSLILTIIIVLAILKKSIFYSAFNIKLTDYLDFSEALLIFFNDILFTTLMILVLVITSVFIPTKGKDPKIDHVFFAAIWLGQLFIELLIILVNVYEVSILIALLISSVCAVISFFFLKFLFKKMEQQNIYEELIKYLWVIPALLFVTFFSAYLEISGVKKKGHIKNISCVFYSSEIITTNNDTAYLGRTKNQIFFYSHKDKKSIIFQVKDIKKIEFK